MEVRNARIEVRLILFLTRKALKYVYINQETKSFFQFEIIINMINVLVSYFRFIWIPILWVYGHYV